MSVIAKCPNCSAEFDATDYDPGDQFQCPDCGAIVTVPSTSQTAKKLSISDRSRIGSGIRKKSSGIKPGKQATGKMRTSGGSRRPSGNRPPSAHRPASQNRAMRAGRSYQEDAEYSVETNSNTKKMVLIFSGLAVVVIVLVGVLFYLNQGDDADNTDKIAKTDEDPKVNNADTNPIVIPEEQVKDTTDKTDDKKTEQETKKEEPVAPKEIVRSAEYKQLVEDYYNKIVTAKIDDKEYLYDLENSTVSKIRQEIEKTLKIYKQFPTLKTPDDYYFFALFTKQQDEAIENYSECINLLVNDVKWKFLDLTYYAYYKRGVEYMRDREKVDEVLSDFAVVVEMQPEFAPVYYQRSMLYFRVKKYQECYWDIQSAMKFDEKYEQYRELKQMMKTCAKNGAKPRITDEDRREAIKELTEKIEENDKDANFLYQRAQQYMALKEWKKAEDDFTKCIDLISQDPKTQPSVLVMVKRERIICWRETGQLEKALKAINELMNEVEDDAMLYATRGLIHLKMKKYRDAKFDLTYATDLNNELKKDEKIQNALKECEEHLK